MNIRNTVNAVTEAALARIEELRQALIKIAPVLGGRPMRISNAVLARELGVSEAYLCQVLKGRRNAGPKLLRALGLERVEQVTVRELREKGDENDNGQAS